MKSLMLRWLCLLSLSLPLLFWFAHVIRRDGQPPAAHRTGLKGYMRITPGRTDQFRPLSQQFLDMHCSQCALVSSSGQMLGAGAGEEIDKIECVIRMNNAPTAGYERDVGVRTSVRVVSHTSVPLLVKNELHYFQQSADTTYVFWGPERNMRQDGKGRIFNALLRIAKRMKTGAFLSTGFFTMILAIDMCDSIHVYGMIDDNYCSRANHSVVPYHYYERNRIDECRMYRVHENTRRGGHRFITEKAIYAKWATRHKMDFKHPSWSL
uniref:alpha-N-acetyl-neuraminyl-2,3-beta-galactosyl-1, 3-N-acetyl-galactosaminide alpha-2,6-sialyltransferase isoform X4 n=1 Tax=Scatophagus argus TaxID=75038 RepID=UPI001ED7FBA0|nr:alpha-N-acetyl-neuraminyl-2,3-beta-galactosyl-1,3-N-acetyl-galactosaminide alpha-2,6-sialyltransferase isoform X4 [Scatophagus argus]